jgi:uncharacterized protein (DUF433 family)
MPSSTPEPWIVSRPGLLGGKPCVRGTRLSVELLRDLATRMTPAEILAEYPHLPAAGLAAALDTTQETKP